MCAYSIKKFHRILGLTPHLPPEHRVKKRQTDTLHDMRPPTFRQSCTVSEAVLLGRGSARSIKGSKQWLSRWQTCIYGRMRVRILARRVRVSVCRVPQRHGGGPRTNTTQMYAGSHKCMQGLTDVCRVPQVHAGSHKGMEASHKYNTEWGSFGTPLLATRMR